MAVNRVHTFADYAKLLTTDPLEVKALCNDLLIQVTQFFRDADSFEFLKTTLFPTLVKDRADEDPIRIWVAGCSSGQEVYSILMSLIEFLSENDHNFPIQMFGTDINELAISKARSGVYNEHAVQTLSRERLRRFFKKEGKEYEFSKSLRECCIFARHNLLTDPPFARLDLLSCQNVLIYFDNVLQKRVLPIFHYALKPLGFLLLGPAETVGAAPELFNQEKNGMPAYSKSQMVSRLHFDFSGTQIISSRAISPPSVGSENNGVTLGIQIQREADRVCMAEFAPPGVVFNDKLEVLQFKGRTGPYFEHSSGFANFELLQMLKEGLVLEVRRSIEKLRKKGERIRKEGIQVQFNGDTHRVAIELFPLRIASTEERFFYLTFEDMDAASFVETKKRRAAKQASVTPVNENEQIGTLRSELASTKDYLQSINEQKEAANEELRAANEEIMSSNEELQSTNEELHTAKEELQSTNEELMTVNDELRIRNKDLSRLNDDQNNLFKSLSVAVVMLNKELRIRKFTPIAEKLLRLIPSDVGRSIGDIKPNIEIKDLENRLLEVIRTMLPMDLESQAFDGKWYSIQIRPYRTSDDRIDGAILIFSDITGIKRIAGYAEEIEEIIRQPLLFLSADLKIVRANARFYKLFKTDAKDTAGRFLYDLGNGQWKDPKLISALKDLIPKKTTLENFEFSRDFPGIGKKTIRLYAQILRHHEAEEPTIILVLEAVQFAA
jgi:two-component system CheB/CheR fusion protein